MIGKDFPISEYYKDHIIDGLTIKRGGNWWSAILLISDPRSNANFINFYKWQYKDKVWKTRSKFKITKLKDLEKVKEILNEFSDKMD